MSASCFVPSPTMVTRAGRNDTSKDVMVPSISELANGNPFNLPRLPIPLLENTARLYADSCRGLAPVTKSADGTVEQLCDAFNEEIEAHLKKLNNFVSISGPDIQRLLVERDNTNADQGRYPFSFIEEIWDGVYLNDANSLPINNNITMVSKVLDPSWSQSRLAAKAARACAKWLVSATEGTLPVSGKPIRMCMAALSNQFGLARIPGEVRDEKTAAKSVAEAVRYVSVICKGEVFLVSMTDKDGRLRSEDDLNQSFTSLLENAAETDSSNSIPILTTANRREWLRARTELHGINSVNSTNLKFIDHSLIVLCLDSDPVSSLIDLQYKHVVGCSPESISQSPTAVRNRWYDKHQIVIPCTPCERIGVITEHSFSDGLLWWSWMRAVYDDITLGGGALPDPGDSIISPPAQLNQTEVPFGKKYGNGVISLQFSLNPEVKSVVTKSLIAHTESIKNLVIGLTTIAVGKEESKTVFKMSFDGFCLACVQLAFARKHGFMTATYKPASTASFFHGRTEAVRSATPALNAFIRAFLGGKHSNADLVALLHAATTAHRDLSIAASRGGGVDRHLLALKVIANELQDETALTFFNDKLFKQSSNWILSTTTNVEPYLDWGSFCSVTPTGYGISFFWRKDVVNVSVLSFKDAENSEMKTNAVEFAEEIGRTATELATILRDAAKAADENGK